MALKKHKLKNVNPVHTHLFIAGEGYIHIESMTDEYAEKLYNEGKTHYIELANDNEGLSQPTEKKANK